MQEDSAMKRLFGLVLIAGGVLILLANFKVFQIDDFTNLINYLWPSALILLGSVSYTHLTLPTN
jgi:hypothetical protein